MGKKKLTSGRRFVYAVKRNNPADGKPEYAPASRYASNGVGFERAKIFSQRGGATSRANYRNYRVKPGQEWSVIPCEVLPVDGASIVDDTPPQRYTLVMDNSAHTYAIPVEKSTEWDEFCAIPEDDPLSWTVPPWATRVDGSLTFTDPRS